MSGFQVVSWGSISFAKGWERRRKKQADPPHTSVAFPTSKTEMHPLLPTQVQFLDGRTLCQVLRRALQRNGTALQDIGDTGNAQCLASVLLNQGNRQSLFAIQAG